MIAIDYWLDVVTFTIGVIINVAGIIVSYMRFRQNNNTALYGLVFPMMLLVGSHSLFLINTLTGTSNFPFRYWLRIVDMSQTIAIISMLWLGYKHHDQIKNIINNNHVEKYDI